MLQLIICLMEALAKYNAAQTHKYRPITDADGFRLLILYPSDQSDADIRCSILHARLIEYEYDPIPELFGHYTAISYTWGDATNLEMIWIDEAKASITRNLHEALKHMRDTSEPRRLWADAICINQRDDEEKSSQVRMMGRIYATAKHTNIYVGMIDKSVEFNASICPEPTLDSRQLPKGVAENTAQKPWFKRVWVLQELVLSLDPWIQAGYDRWRWHDFCMAISACALIPQVTQITVSTAAAFKRVSKMDKVCRAFQRDNNYGIVDLDLIAFVSARRGLESTDPRDMVFAHTGLASDRDELPFLVDYSRSTEQIYTNFACYQVEKDCNLRILFHAKELVLSEIQTPSWIPDWLSPLEAQRKQVLDFEDAPRYINQHLDPVQYCVEATFQMCIRDRDTTRLVVLGSQYETVVKFSKILNHDEIRREDMKTLQDQMDIIRANLQQRSAYPADGECHVDWESFCSFYNAYEDLYNIWRCHIEDDEILPKLQKVTKCAAPEPWNMPARDAFADCLVANVHPYLHVEFFKDRRLARTSLGNLVLVPAAVKQGDFLFHSLSGRIREPFVFRPYVNTPGSSDCNTIRSKVEQRRTARYPLMMDFDVADLPIMHCAFVGLAFTHGNEYDELGVASRMKDREFWGAVGEAKLAKRLELQKIYPGTIFVVH